jgi:2-oxoisovalerate dehydrogenase E1 component
MKFERKRLSDQFLFTLYRDLLLPRMIEEKMLILLRQGKISKWFSGIGQEGIAVGVTAALQEKDYILPLHRNLGVFTTRNIPLKRLICQWLGKMEGFTKGRDRSFHFASPEDRIIGMISHLGAMLPVADGLALASNLDQDDFIAVPFSGDGGASEGDFHEAINVASVWQLPVLFIIESNGYGLSTPSSEQFKAKRLADRARGYGIKGYTIDGNNVLEVYHTVTRIAKQMRKKREPVILECETFRMRGHEEASGTKYVPKELFEIWKEKDPISNYENFLKSEGLLDDQQIKAIRAELKEYINQSVEEGFAEPDIEVDLELETGEIYAPFNPVRVSGGENHSEKRFVDAISDGLREAMRKFPELVIMGQDVAEYGGVFKITEGFLDEFGKERVRNTPICESAIIGAGMGISLAGKKAMVEMQFADFVSCGFNQIVNNLAKNHYRWGHAPDVVIRMPTGGGVGAGPFHSQSNEAWFTHVPGLKVVYPSTPADAKGLLIAAIEDPNPVLFFEHKLLYRSVSESVPEGYYNLPLGQARVVTEGEDITIVSYGMAVNWARKVVSEMSDLSAEIIDLRTLIPWDKTAVFNSVKKTGKCLVLVEDTATGSFGAEIVAAISENCFEYLDGPVTRVSSLDTPVPFNPKLETQFLGSARLKEKLSLLVDY